QTAAFSGFPNAFFSVSADRGEKHAFPVDAAVPAPGARYAPAAGFLLDVRADRFDLFWRASSSAEAQSIGTATNADLSARIAAAWKEHGEHRDAADKLVDQLLLYVANDVEYARIVFTLDAIAATTRKIIFDGSERVAPALNVTFRLPEEHD